MMYNIVAVINIRFFLNRNSCYYCSLIRCDTQLIKLTSYVMAFKIDIRAARDPKVVDVYLYGDISSWGDLQPANISKQFTELEKKYTSARLHINSNGGQITEGIAIHSVLSNTTMELEIIVDGIAASMAAILVQVPKAKRHMSKYSKMMLHGPSGYASGTSEDLRQYAQMMDDFEVTLIQIVCDRTGMDNTSVKSKWFDGKDHWLSPQQALDAKLIDAIVEGQVTREAKNSLDPAFIYNFYQEQISNLNYTEMDFTKIIALLGLAATSTEQQVMDFVGNLVAENTTLQTQLTGLQTEVDGLKAQVTATRKAEITGMISAAITAKKITEAQRPMYESLAGKDFDNTKAILDAAQPYQPLTKVPGQQDDSPVIPVDRAGWTFTDWQAKDGKGLQDLKDNHKEEYKALYTKSFGKEPV